MRELIFGDAVSPERLRDHEVGGGKLGLRKPRCPRIKADRPCRLKPGPANLHVGWRLAWQGLSALVLFLVRPLFLLLLQPDFATAYPGVELRPKA